MVAALLAVFLFELLRTAWISDDAAITLRTVLNWLHGYGPRFNIDERVQAYTHPLWFLILTGLSWVLKNVFAATFAASIGLSLAGFYLLCRLADQTLSLVLAAGLLILSKAYVDFDTSGLENPLSHVLLLAAFVLATACRDSQVPAWRVRGFFATAGLIYLTRPDLALLVAPLTAWVCWHRRRQPGALAVALLTGALPVLCWTAFSLYYYGFPFPNTAYAKLGTGIDRWDLLKQGGTYFLHTLKTDPLTLFGIVTGLALAWHQGTTARLLAFGVLLYLGYVAYIGGDFMEGRFFTAPLLVSAIIVARHSWHPVAAWTTGAIVLGLGVLNLGGTLLSSKDYSDHQFYAGIANERGDYYQYTGLLTTDKEIFTLPQWQVGPDHAVDSTCGLLGFFSLKAGPATHFLDTCALADPLLSRLPARFDPGWRIGHFFRRIPTDYVESFQRDQNLLVDPKTHAFYDVIRLITRGELNDPKRWSAIINMNLGRVPPPDWAMYRFQKAPLTSGRWTEIIPIERLSRVVDGVLWRQPSMLHFADKVFIQLPKPTRVRTIDISVGEPYAYELYARQGDRYELAATVEPTHDFKIVRHVMAIKLSLQPTDRLMIHTMNADGVSVLGHLVVQ